MPDEPVGSPAGDPKPTETVPATPPAKPPEGAPGATDKTTPGSPADIDPQMRFEIPKKDGSGVEIATLQEMADAFTSKGEGIDPEQAKKFDAFEKAVSQNDRAAMHNLMDMYLPPKEEPAAAEGEDRVAVLEREMRELKQTLSTQQPVVQQIEDARIHNGVRMLIEQQGQQVPYLAKEPGEGARMVTGKIAELREAAEAQLGITREQFDKHPRRQQILAAAMMDCERQLKSWADRFRDFNPGVEAATQTKETTGAVDDQRAGPPDRAPARFRVDGGRLVDTAGQAVAQTPYGEMRPVPTEPLSSEPSGSAVGPVPAEPVSGPHTVEQMKDGMRKRLQEITTE